MFEYTRHNRYFCSLEGSAGYGCRPDYAGSSLSIGTPLAKVSSTGASVVLPGDNVSPCRLSFMSWHPRMRNIQETEWDHYG
jgi:hypothetical protein